MKYFVYLFTISILINGCCSKKKTVKQNDSPTAQTTSDTEMSDEERREKLAEVMKNEKVPNQSEEAYKLIEKEIPENTVARMQRTACFGRCPIYTVTIFEDGSAEYFGKKFTPREGKYTAKVDQQFIEKLRARAKEINFFELDNIYDKEAITDLPSTIVSIKGEDGIKTVIDRFDSPEKLGQFEIYFDSLVEELNWVSAEKD